ncbi:hypothetical protein INT48_003402 [Thamnidium elegans]|uniref:Uncharacterized protein n=1 Tax=Thamnidium elegans TaxID=101142 RepID=A0A8H7SR15_9FUNG|nr:hypothetical protein INT48_003402 [Thamnidium elegans]
MNSTQLDIPQFVVIHDQLKKAYKHPIIHYVFEGDPFPDVPKDELIIVELDSTASQLLNVDSYSPHFQVTDCVLEQSQLSDQFEEDASLLNLTIEGVSSIKPDSNDILQPIRSMDNLKEVIANFKNR